MKKLLLLTIAYTPMVVYTSYSIWNKQPNSGIDYFSMAISGLLGIAGSVIFTYLKMPRKK